METRSGSVRMREAPRRSTPSRDRAGAASSPEGPGTSRSTTSRPTGALSRRRRTTEPTMRGLAPGETKERDLSWLDTSEPFDISSDGKTLLFREEGGGAGSPIGAAFIRGMDGAPAVRLGDGNPDGSLTRRQVGVGGSEPAAAGAARSHPNGPRRAKGPHPRLDQPPGRATSSPTASGFSSWGENRASSAGAVSTFRTWREEHRARYRSRSKGPGSHRDRFQLMAGNSSS